MLGFFAATYILQKRKNQYLTDKKSLFVLQADLLDIFSWEPHYIP
jgi:hypothetical protein